MSRLANHRPRRGKSHPAKTRHHATHDRNPPGSKFLRRCYKAKNEERGSAEKALAWYAGYLAEKDRQARQRAARKKLARQLRAAAQ